MDFEGLTCKQNNNSSILQDLVALNHRHLLEEENNALPPPPSPKSSSTCDSEELEHYNCTIKCDDERQQEYPKQVGDNIILGPNGTQMPLRSYRSIGWQSARSTTRKLLQLIFGSDVLATHTLSGKPSPAFYGRERPAKAQLEPEKVDDITHCVLSKFECTKREVRDAITNKCSDIAKTYKRRRRVVGIKLTSKKK